VSPRDALGDSLLTVFSLPASRTLGDSGLPGGKRRSPLRAFEPWFKRGVLPLYFVRVGCTIS
jgi:hypothetical protein